MAEDYSETTETTDTSDVSSDTSDTTDTFDYTADDTSDDMDLSDDGSDEISDGDSKTEVEDGDNNDIEEDDADNYTEDVETENTSDTLDDAERDGPESLPDGDEDISSSAESDSRENTGDDGPRDLSDDTYDPAVFDNDGNLKVMNNEEYASLSADQQSAFENKYNDLSPEEQQNYDAKFAQAELNNYNKHVENGDIVPNEDAEREMKDAINGKYSGDDDLNGTVGEWCTKVITSAGVTAIGKFAGLNTSEIRALNADLSSRAGEIGREYVPKVMENITETAYAQQGSRIPNPQRINVSDENGTHTEFLSDYTPTNGTLKDNEAKNNDLSVAEKQQIKSETGWDNKIIDSIQNKQQYDIYKGANLRENCINDRKCLTKDINYDYVDPKTGLTNRELMSKGRSPYDTVTGEKIELHHMGQEYDAPFAELAENSEHGDGNHTLLHPKTINSWRNNSELLNDYQKEKINYWKTRSKGEAA